MNFDKFIQYLSIQDLSGIKREFQIEFLNKSDVNGKLPIHLACINGSKDIVYYFIEQHCNIEACDSDGWRPIHHAVFEHKIDILKILIGAGCDLDCIKKKNETLMDFSRQKNNIEVISIIQRAMKNMRIGKAMNLKCSSQCDHKFCMQSFCLNEFQRGELLSRGRLGKLYRIKESESTREFGMKKIGWRPNYNDTEETIQKEAGIVEKNINEHRTKLIHPRIVRNYGAIIDHFKMYVFMEYFSMGSISEKIAKNYQYGLPEEMIFRYTHQILEGLLYLHNRNIIHKGIQTSNILLDENDNCKLTNMGLKELVDSNSKQTLQPKENDTIVNVQSTLRLKSNYTSANYIAPEIIKGFKFCDRSDIWSLGATIFEMFTGEPPFHNFKHNFVLIEIGRDHLPELPDHKAYTESKVTELINQIFISDPEERPTAEELLKNKILISSK